MLIALLAATGLAGAGPHPPSKLSAAGPRLGPVAVVEVALPDHAALEELVQGGYDIGKVRGDVATVYATPEELARLEQAGYDCRVTDWQPRPRTTEEETLHKELGLYHDYASLTSDLEEYAEAHPDVCRLYTLGQSVEGRELWAVLITDNPDDEEDEPEFKYISTMHGDEPVGTELCLYFIDLLLSQYGLDERITGLVDGTAIWIVPLMNPDGLELGSRFNAEGYDLNRSFPIYPVDFTGTIFDWEPLDGDGRPPEVSHVMRWTAENSFVLSANFHTGSLVVNYPYDHDNKPSGQDAPTPDDLLFEEISRWYAVHNLAMWNSREFPGGITNGSAWYAISGGMQDWNYRYAGCNEVTIELTDTKMPCACELGAYWTDNSQSMLSYLEAVHIGVRGVITDRATGAPLWAEVRVEGNAHPAFTDPDLGDYHRMLLPGTYHLTYSAPGYVIRSVPNVTVTEGPASRVDLELASADVNSDGAVDAADIQKVINAILGIDPSLDCDFDGGGVTATDLQLIIRTVLSTAQHK